MTGLGAPILAAAAALAYRPFIDPLSIHDWWWALLPPLSFGIAVVYKSVRVKDLRTYWRQVIVMTIQIVLAMVMLAAATYVFVEVYVRWLAEQ